MLESGDYRYRSGLPLGQIVALALLLIGLFSFLAILIKI